MKILRLKVRRSNHFKNYKNKRYHSVQHYVTIPEKSDLIYRDEVLVMDIETAKEIASHIIPFAKWLDKEIDRAAIEFLKVLGKWQEEWEKDPWEL